MLELRRQRVSHHDIHLNLVLHVSHHVQHLLRAGLLPEVVRRKAGDDEVLAPAEDALRDVEERLRRGMRLSRELRGCFSGRSRLRFLLGCCGGERLVLEPSVCVRCV